MDSIMSTNFKTILIGQKVIDTRKPTEVCELLGVMKYNVRLRRPSGKINRVDQKYITTRIPQKDKRT